MEITKTNGVIYFTDGAKSTMIPQEILQAAVIEKSGGGINIIYSKGGKDTVLNILYANVTNPVVTSSDTLISELYTLIGQLPSGVPASPKVYKAILTQSGTNAPVATVLNGNDANYLSGVTFSRDSAGTYYILRTGFSATNTLVHFDRATNKLSTHSLTSGTNYILYEQYELSGGTATKYEGIIMGFITIEYYG